MVWYRLRSLINTCNFFKRCTKLMNWTVHIFACRVLFLHLKKCVLIIYFTIRELWMPHHIATVFPVALEIRRWVCFFLLKYQASQILAAQNILILNYQNESKVRVVILCYVPLVYLKVDGGQLESLCYFDHHTHFLTCIVIILSCNHVL